MLNPFGANTISEVNILGIPTVTWSVDVMSCLVVNRVTSYLVDKSTPEEMDNAILEYFSKTQEERQEMKEMCKKIARMRFSKEALDAERKKFVRKIFGEVSDVNPFYKS